MADLSRDVVNVDYILAKAAAAEQIPEAINEITELLRQRHRIRPGRENDFNIRDMSELLKALTPRGAHG